MQARKRVLPARNNPCSRAGNSLVSQVFRGYRSSMSATEIQVDGGVAASSKPLRCPLCGDAAVTFNSRTTVVLRGAVEWLAIFACSESHVFFVPMTLASSVGLNLNPAKSWPLEEMRILVRDRVERARSTALSAAASVDASRHLLQCIRRTRNKWRSRREQRELGFSTPGLKTTRPQTIQ